MREKAHAEHQMSPRRPDRQWPGDLSPQFDGRVLVKTVFVKRLPYSTAQVKYNLHIAAGKHRILIGGIALGFEDIIVPDVRGQYLGGPEMLKFHLLNI